MTALHKSEKRVGHYGNCTFEVWSHTVQSCLWVRDGENYLPLGRHKHSGRSWGEHLLTAILILQLLNEGPNIFRQMFGFLVVDFKLPEQTVTSSM